MSVVAAFAVPHPPLAIHGVGRGQEKGITATLEAYHEVGRRIAAFDPDVLIISSPHATCYSDYIHISPGKHASGDFAQFGDPADEVECDYDAELVRAIEREGALAGIPCGTQGERDRSLDHATMVPLSFIQEEGVRCPIVRMGISGLSSLDHYRLGQCIERATEQLDRRAVYVASGDLAHKLLDDGPYGFAPEAPIFDKAICDIFASGDFGDMFELSPALVEGAAQCGLNSFLIMAGALDGRAVTAELLSYEGPFGVGYGVAEFIPGDADPDRCFGDAYEAAQRAEIQQLREGEDPWVALARASLESWVRDHKKIVVPDGLPPELTTTRAGAFCSLHKNGELRGCIGTTAPTRKNLAEEIIENAISAGTRDPRFMPVTADELDDLVYSVDVLTPAEPVADESELDPARYGVIVSASGGRRGLLLPDLEGVDTVEEQIDISRRKGGIGENEPITLERFEVVRHH